MIELTNKIHNCDNAEILAQLPDKSLDLILEDMPYNTTEIAFEYAVDLQKFWDLRLKKIKDNGAIVLTGQQPFTTDLIVSNRKLFRYEIIWEKTNKQGFLNANKMPLRGHENILLFYKSLPTYNPQKYFIGTQSWAKVHPPTKKRNEAYSKKGYELISYEDTGWRHPHTVVKISNHNGGGLKGKQTTIHPTQKPLELFSWLIRTYTDEGDLVFDGFGGSATTAISCLREKRNFIVCEWDKDYFNKSQTRLANEQNNLFSSL